VGIIVHEGGDGHRGAGNENELDCIAVLLEKALSPSGEAAQMPTLSTRWFEPCPETAVVYEESYLSYRRLFDALEECTP